LGTEIIGACGRALLALSAALAAHASSKAFGITFLGRPRTNAAKGARETDRFSLAAMFVFAALCLIAGILPGLFIDRLSAGGEESRRRSDAGADWDRLALDRADRPRAAAPTTAFSCSFFITVSASLAAFAIHRLASDIVRKAPAWDCGFPDANPATQYTAASFGQPIRRVAEG